MLHTEGITDRPREWKLHLRPGEGGMKNNELGKATRNKQNYN